MKVEVLVESILSATDSAKILGDWREITSSCSVTEQAWAHKLVSKKLIEAIMEVR